MSLVQLVICLTDLTPFYFPVVWGVLMWCSLFYTTIDELFQPASRRLANWAYYNWMVAYNLTLLLLFPFLFFPCFLSPGLLFLRSSLRPFIRSTASCMQAKRHFDLKI